MFSGAVPPDGHYELKQHLAEIVDLFGPVPKALLEKGCQDIVQLVFNDEGMVRHAPPINRPGLPSERIIARFGPGSHGRFCFLFIRDDEN
jgi:serine/threonine-protein kinase SRPK3